MYVPHCRVNICCLVFFVACTRRIYLTFFKRDCFASRFSFVFGFQEETISAGCFLMDLFCEGWLWHVLCVVYNFSRLSLLRIV